MAFPIVAIGASAGGLEAISELLAALPPKSGIAYVVIQHLDPNHESLPPELLAKKTLMPVTAVHDGALVEAGHVYVIPPNATLTVHDGRFRLAKRVGGPGQHLPIDAFFRFLAESQADAAIGVVLSGADADGARGIQTLKASGGTESIKRQAVADWIREDSAHKDEFLAMLAHELRNPLSPIVHATHALRHGRAGGDSSRLYELIERQTRRLVRLVDDLLDVARISSGHIQLKRESVDLAQIARNAADAIAARIEESKHQFSIALPETPVRVYGDAVRLEQVVSNLLDNAIKYTGSGGQIALKLSEQEGEAVLSVRDTGVGLPPEKLEAIFELFIQIDATLAHTRGGLGIGLTLVRRLLEMHGGRIEAHSGGIGQGTEFIAWLPLQLAREAPVPPALTEDRSSAVETTGRLLVVDDNEDAAESVAVLTRSWGFEVAVAHDAHTALALADSFLPDRAILDIGLPGINGYELARCLRERERPLYLVAMTGYGREEDRRSALAAGFDEHIVKPADAALLRRLLTLRLGATAERRAR